MAAPPVLLIPRPTWLTTVSLLGPYARAQVEAGLYWYGIRTEAAAVVSLVGIPAQVNNTRNFEVPDDDLAGLSRRIPEPLVVVGALHIHPGSDTNHSDHDDKRAVSRKILSLVLPFYGRDPKLEQAAVHECRDGHWSRLADDEAQARVHIIPELIDTRR